ncbi:cobalamin biosynthesis protein [Tateyamaria omphalii]|uniref:cobalamin biosynthesis protein n=1 Tax=Tateyamaria omphalii TaxID=299262 RepID=UPI001C99377B|nr:cobalamin biosynthesis protein [Tateyamaria omphalii]MBY5931783.1 cobalamin biosynthesis protein [Tateyamaria omphalii]
MIVAGFGFNTQASAESVADALAQHAVTPDAVATLEEKAGALRVLAKDLDVPVLPVSRDVAAAQTTVTRSKRSTAEKGTPSVAEATALAAAGPGATLIGPRTISNDRMATCAIAQGPET